MQYDEMIEAMVRRLPIDAVRARSLLAAVVQALGETSRRGEMGDLRSQLPGELKGIEPDASAPDRSVEEFCSRVGNLAGADDSDQARQFTTVALGVLAEGVTAGQLSQLLASLPHGYAQLLPTQAEYER
jgi:uncharacterized protein (DUF2267 family)